MYKSVIAILFVFLLFGNAVGKVSGSAIQRNIEIYKKGLMKAIVDRKTLEELKRMLPTGPEGRDPRIEKDVFTVPVEKNKAAIEILKEQIKFLETKANELRKLLKLQKSIKARWDKFWTR